MLPGRTVFAELMDHVSRFEFQKCVCRYDGNYKSSRFSCWDQYLCMAFAQLTYRESLRDIEACLRAVQPRLYHVGIRTRVARATMADANETRDWRIYADFAQGLIRTARGLYVNEPLSVDLADTVYALDATIIELCLSVFPWAHYRRRDAAIKLHTLVDLRGAIPTVVQITAGKCADVTALDTLVLEVGAIYLMDRGYVDFTRLHRFTEEAAFFVTRTKKGIRFTRCARSGRLLGHRRQHHLRLLLRRRHVHGRAARIRTHGADCRKVRTRSARSDPSDHRAVG